MSAMAWISYLGLALILGVFGQLARVAMGMKKLHDKNAATGTKTPFDPKKFWISICLGGLAGVLTALSMWEGATRFLDREFLLTIMAAGYAGSDLIEGLIERAGATFPASVERANAIENSAR